MKFREEVVKVPSVMAVLASKGRPALDEEEVISFQSTVVKEDRENREKEWRKENRIAGLMMHDTFRWISLVFIALLLAAGMLWGVAYSVGIAGILAVLLLVVGPLLAWSELQKSVTGKSWQRMPFKDFEEREYKERNKTAAYEIYPASNYSDIVLEVEWHEASSVRFLVASSGREPNRVAYYIDFWKVA